MFEGEVARLRAELERREKLERETKLLADAKAEAERLRAETKRLRTERDETERELIQVRARVKGDIESAERDATYTRCTQSTSTAARTSTTPVFSFGTSSMKSAYASRTIANERSEDGTLPEMAESESSTTTSRDDVSVSVSVSSPSLRFLRASRVASGGSKSSWRT